MSKKYIYILAVATFAVISESAVVSALGDAFPVKGYTILLAMIPVLALFIAMIAVNQKIAIPRLLLRKRYKLYLAVVSLMALLIPLASLFTEYAIRRYWGLEQRITDPTSPWILVDSICNATLIFLIILGLGTFAIFSKWNSLLEYEDKIARSLNRYISEVKNRLNPDGMLGRLDNILNDLDKSVSRANQCIRDFCKQLRQQLYELPSPDVPTERNIDSDYSAVATFLTSRKYRLWRLVTGFLILLTISSETFFETPDHPVFSAENITGVAALLLFFMAITATTAGWLFRRFRRHNNPRVYVRDICILIVCMVVPMIVIQVLTYNRSPYSGIFPWQIMLISTLGTSVALILYLAGVSSIKMLQQWIRVQRRIVLLRADTSRQEYLFLRKQINPHFLFNVLNNIGILTEEDTGQARVMLMQLRQLLVYQFTNGESPYVTVGDEMSFIRPYIELQKSRMDSLDYKISVDNLSEDEKIPSLIFITFVENAIKHSSDIDGHRSIRITVTKEKRGIRFRCDNTCADQPTVYGPKDAASGGIGLRNTIRRLNLIYGDRHNLSLTRNNNIYSVNLFIPGQ